MQNFIDKKTGQLYAYEDDCDPALIFEFLEPITQEEADSISHANNAPSVEDSWRETEIAFITEQLLMIEDGDPGALPGTASQWRAYRVDVRSWKDGNPSFPQKERRPSRPD